MLRAWRLQAEPAAGVEIDAEALPEHRTLYLDYEGPVSGGRGTVVRWDAGEYAGGLDGTRLSLTLRGARLQGGVTLEDLGTDGWRFVCGPES